MENKEIHAAQTAMVDRQSGDRYENFQVGGSGLNLIGPFSGVFNYGVSESSKECHQVFRTTEYERHKARNPDRVEGTCKWFLKHEKYTEWQKSGSSLLWVSADPGCGKSVLSKSLVDEELHESTTRATCYFFFKDDNEDQGAATNALCALLHQLFTQRPNLLQHAESIYNANKEKLKENFHLLWEILATAAADPQAGEIVCILDALDECQESERKLLISTICAFYQSLWNSKNNMALKFLVTSRPYLSIEMAFTRLTNKIPTIRLAGEDEPEEIRKEIGLVASEEVKSLTQELHLDAGDVVLLRQELSRVKHWTYLWLKLIFDLIRADFESLTRKENREKIFHAIPDSVDAAYTAILNKSPDKARARKLLSIICAALRPLSVKEMIVALMIEPHHRALEDLELSSESRSKILIRNLCGLFVRVIDGKVYLLHQTAKEFLMSQHYSIELASGLCSNGPWKHSITTKSSNLLLAQICVWYLLLSEFDTFGPFTVGNVPEYRDLALEAIDSHFSRHDFIQYSATNWAVHFRTAMIQENAPLIDLALKVCATKSLRFTTWFSIFWYEHHDSTFPAGLETLHVTSLLGLDRVVQRLLAAPAVKVNEPDELNRTPLSWAAKMGHKAVMMTLLRKQGDRAKITEEVLKAAAGNFRSGEDLVMLLLEHQDKEIKITGEVFEAAAGNLRSGKEVMKLLLDRRGDEVKITDKVVKAAAAMNSGGKEIMELLLDRCGDKVKITDEVVKLAAWNFGSGKEVMELLLDRRGDEVKITDELVKAVARSGGKELMKLLLDRRGDEVKITDELVKAAAGSSGKEFMKLLLDRRGDEVKITDEVVKAAAASYSGSKEVMELLLDRRGDEVKITDELVKAVAGSFGKELMKLLLDRRGDEVKITDEVVKAAAANKRGGKEIMKLLLDRRGDEVKITAEVFEVAAASYGGGKEIMELLLDRCGDEVKITDEVVKAAAGNPGIGKEIMELLLDRRGDEVKITAEVFEVAAASYDGGKEIMELLLDRCGDEVKITDEVVKAAAANKRGGKEIMKLLLDRRGDEVKITAEVFEVAAASYGGGKEIMELLLDRCGDEVKITDEVVKAAAGNPGSGKEVMELLLDRRGGEVKITDEVVKAAAGNPGRGKDVMELLLDRRGEEVKITDEVVKAAAASYSGGNELYLDRQGDKFMTTEEVVKAATGKYVSGKEVMMLLLDQHDQNFEFTDQLLQAIAASFSHDKIIGLLLKQYRRNLDTRRQNILLSALPGFEKLSDTLVRYREDGSRWNYVSLRE